MKSEGAVARGLRPAFSTGLGFVKGMVRTKLSRVVVRDARENHKGRDDLPYYGYPAFTGCSSAWPERLDGVQKAEGSNPFTLITKDSLPRLPNVVANLRQNNADDRNTVFRRKKTRTYGENKIDAVLIYVPQAEKICWFGPECFCGKAFITIRLQPPGNGQRAGIKMISDFEW